MKTLITFPLVKDNEVFLPFPDSLICLGSFLKNRGVGFKIFHESPYNIDNLVKTIKDYKPNIVGFSCDSANFNNCFELANLVKAIDKNTYVILGGIHATFFHRAILERIPPVDIIVRGEGEETLLEIIESIERTNNRADFSKIKGITYRSNDRVFVTPERPFIKNLDTLPFLSYDLIDMKKIESRIFPNSWWPLHAGRGCCYHCKYCASLGLWRKTYRHKSTQRVLKEIKILMNHNGIKEFYFHDLTFTINRKRVKEICSYLIEEKIKTEWGCATRIDCVDKDLLKIMREAGCRIIIYGVESFCDKMLSLMGKGYRTAQAIEVLNYTNKLSIETRFELLFGFPGETENTLRETMQSLKKIEKGVMHNKIHIFKLHPGSMIYDRLKNLGFINDEAWFSGFRMEHFVYQFYPHSFIKKIYETEKEIKDKFREDYKNRQK